MQTSLKTSIQVIFFSKTFRLMIPHFTLLPCHKFDPEHIHCLFHKNSSSDEHWWSSSPGHRRTDTWWGHSETWGPGRWWSVCSWWSDRGTSGSHSPESPAPPRRGGTPPSPQGPGTPSTGCSSWWCNPSDPRVLESAGTPEDKHFHYFTHYTSFNQIREILNIILPYLYQSECRQRNIQNHQ